MAQTWLLNETISIESIQATYRINFRSNETEYTIFDIGYNVAGSLVYGQNAGLFDMVYNFKGVWTNDVYRVVVFETAPTGDLLSWLQANAVKQVVYTNEVVVNGETILDLRSDTVTPETLQEGYAAHNKAGQPIIGTLKPGITPTGTLEITADGIYNVAQYASAIVSAGENVQFRRFKGSITSTITGADAEVLLIDDPIIGHIVNLNNFIIWLTTDFLENTAYTLLGCVAAGSMHIISTNHYQFMHRIGAEAGVFNDNGAVVPITATTGRTVGQLIVKNNQLRWFVSSANYAARPCNYTVSIMWEE